MRTLIIDNYDSFTFNLYHLFAEVNGELPVVVRNDAVTWPEIDAASFDNIVISPGPGRPDRQRDVGVSATAITRATVPLLGVCLGHQAICHCFGGVVGPAPEPVHGRLSDIHHLQRDVLADIPSPFAAVRYHSLCVHQLPPVLEAIAWADDLVMAVRHRQRPIWGVQFHPEAVCTTFGRQIAENFRDITHRLRQSAMRHARATPAATLPSSPQRRCANARSSAYAVQTRRVVGPPGPETLFRALFSESRSSFWLDSSADTPATSRWSFMGDGSGPRAEYLTYRMSDRTLTITDAKGTTTRHTSLFAYLDAALRARRVESPAIPIPFALGYVGFLGYELKAECSGRMAHAAPTPDAALLFADRLLAYDHATGDAYLICLTDIDHPGEADEWFHGIEVQLAAPRESHSPAPVPIQTAAAAIQWRHPPEEYLALIDACQREIRDGESYEICLTNSVRVRAEIEPLATYLRLRRLTPAPYAAFLRFGDLAVLSASPERFLRIDADRNVESKPIKGTRPRGRTPAEDDGLRRGLAASVKDRAENMMIVDLVRNDLGAVCEIGSVHVPSLFAVESYAAVHQLVSTVRGRLRADCSAIDCVRAAFPGGSMTGAPKVRTMELIDRLEAAPRGVYAGALGYFGLNGAADLSIVIRTIVRTGASVTLGTGGAIVALSDPHAELAETMLKAAPLIGAISKPAACAAPLDGESPRGAAACMAQSGQDSAS